MRCRDADLSRLLHNNGNYPCKIRVDPWENMFNAVVIKERLEAVEYRLH